MAELKKYVTGLDAEQEYIFNNNFSRYTWTKIRHKLGLDDFTFHDLRKSFCSVLAQNGVSTAVIWCIHSCHTEIVGALFP
jgi:integrase